jgi:Tol biopolymer transport system component
MAKEISELKLKDIECVTAGLTDHEHPAVSSDGKLVAYYAGPFGNIHIYVCDMRGRLARAISAGGGNNTQPAWSPDGKQLAFRHQDSEKDKWEIWTAQVLEDKLPEQLIADPKWHYKHPVYRQDSKEMAYFSDEGSPDVFHIWLLDLENNNRRQVTFGAGQNHAHPVYSPKGDRLIFHAYEGTAMTTPEVTNLYELDMESAEVRRLTEGSDQYKHPFYIDDDLITFHREFNESGLRQLCGMQLSSGKIFELTTGENNDKHPFPYLNEDGKQCLAFASKKLGSRLPGEEKTYDIFTARLEID